MKVRTLTILLFCTAAALLCSTAWSLDEAVLTPTAEHGTKMTEKDKANAEKEFNSAMSVWNTHRYAEGEKLLGRFARV